MESGFNVRVAKFREPGFNHPGIKQLLRESLDMLPCISLYADAVPITG